jgi:hypothetical protein
VQAYAEVAVGGDDSLLVIERPGDHLSLGRLDDCRPATAEHLGIGKLHRKVLREGRTWDVLRDRDDEGS